MHDQLYVHSSIATFTTENYFVINIFMNQGSSTPKTVMSSCVAIGSPWNPNRNRRARRMQRKMRLWRMISNVWSISGRGGMLGTWDGLLSLSVCRRSSSHFSATSWRSYEHIKLVVVLVCICLYVLSVCNAILCHATSHWGIITLFSWIILARFWLWFAFNDLNDRFNQDLN